VSRRRRIVSEDIRQYLETQTTDKSSGCGYKGRGHVRSTYDRERNSRWNIKLRIERKKRSCTPKEEMDWSGIITREAEQTTGIWSVKMMMKYSRMWFEVLWESNRPQIMNWYTYDFTLCRRYLRSSNSSNIVERGGLEGTLGFKLRLRVRQFTAWIYVRIVTWQLKETAVARLRHSKHDLRLYNDDQRENCEVGTRIYIPQEQGRPVIPQGTEEKEIQYLRV
jgi:hypothetical protein